MEKHIRFIIVLYFIIGILGIISGLIILNSFSDSSDSKTISLVGIFYTENITSLHGILLLFYAVPALIAAFGVKKRKNWGRILSMVWAVVNIPSFLVGTIVGIYSLWVFLKDDTKKLFVQSGKESII
jgi:hypothetical protein